MPQPHPSQHSSSDEVLNRGRRNTERAADEFMHEDLEDEMIHDENVPGREHGHIPEEP